MEHQRKTDWGALRDTASEIDDLLERGAVIPARKMLDCLRDHMEAEAEGDIDGIADHRAAALRIHEAAFKQDQHHLEARTEYPVSYDMQNELDTIAAGGFVWGACNRARGFNVIATPDQYGRYGVQARDGERKGDGQGQLVYCHWSTPEQAQAWIRGVEAAPRPPKRPKLKGEKRARMAECQRMASILFAAGGSETPPDVSGFGDC